MRFLFLHSLIFYIFFQSGYVYANSITPDPKKLVAEMSNANSELNYDGVFVYRYDKHIDTMRIIHKKNNDGTIQERLIALTGNKREIIRDNDRVKYFFPENRVAIIEKSKLGQLISLIAPIIMVSSVWFWFDLNEEIEILKNKMELAIFLYF